jgi:hypothetical protein
VSTTDRKAKHDSPKRGDVFEFRVSDGRLGYGVVVLGGGTPYIAIFKPLFTEPPSTADLADEQIALVGETMDALFYHGRWVVVDEGFPIPSSISFPNWKVNANGVPHTTNFDGNTFLPMRPEEADLLDYRFSRAPIAYQTALEAMHGLAEWREDYERLTPAYPARRMTRS